MTRGLLATALLALAAAPLVATAQPSQLNFVNKCGFPIELLHIAAGSSGNTTLVDVGTQLSKSNVTGANYIRHTMELEATLVSITYDLKKGVLYDISIVPPQAGYCSSFEMCRNATNGLRGFNVAVSVEPKRVATGDQCRTLYCGADDAELCKDAFLFPTDSAKKHHRCVYETDFDIVFCPDEVTTIRNIVSDDVNLHNDTIQFPVSATIASSENSTPPGLDFSVAAAADGKNQAAVRAADGAQPNVSPSMAPAPTKVTFDFSGQGNTKDEQAAVRSFETPQPSMTPATLSSPAPDTGTAGLNFDTVTANADVSAKIPELP